MSEVPETSPTFEPLHDAHAIEQAVFIVQFDKAIEEERLKWLNKNAAEKFSTDLPRNATIQGVTINIGTAPALSSQPGFAGFALQKFRNDGLIEKELRVERASITFRTIVYTRWVDIWGQARKYLDEFLPVFLEVGRPLAIGLHYVDKFVWRGTPDDCDVSAILDPRSPYVAAHIFSARDFWHSHSGAFLEPDPQTKRLLNVNVDHLEESELDKTRRVVIIRTSVTDQLNQPGYEPTDMAAVDLVSDICNTHMEDAHTFSKIVLAQIIRPTMAKRIQLGQSQ